MGKLKIFAYFTEFTSKGWVDALNDTGGTKGNSFLTLLVLSIIAYAT
jgi:hypothetical protein